jgi:hypothetical protein
VRHLDVEPHQLAARVEVAVGTLGRDEADPDAAALPHRLEQRPAVVRAA